MSAPQHRRDGGSYYLGLACAFVLMLGALGGASREDELQQFFVRGAAILAIAAALWPLEFSVFRDGRRAAAGLSFVYVLPLMQLVPLAPVLWAGMPGHAVYAAVAQQSGTIGWRPLTVSPDLTLNSLAALLPATAIGLIALALDFRRRVLLARITTGIACASAVLGLLQFAAGGVALHLFQTSSEDAAVGLFANRNHQAVFLACALPISAALATTKAYSTGISRPSLALQLSTAALLLTGLGATGSRMGLLLGAVGIAAAATIYVVSGRAVEAIRSTGPRIWLPVCASATMVLFVVSSLIWRAGAVTRLASDPVDQTRAAALRPMFTAARAFFPFGAGFGTFDAVYRRFEPDSLLSTIYLNQAHNEPLQLAIEGGLGALLLLVLFLAWWAKAALRAVRLNDSVSRWAMGMAMAATTLILMLSSLVDYPLRTPLLSGLFAIACVELLRSRRRAFPLSST